MFLLGALLSVGCAPLRSDPLPEIGPPEMGVVETVRRLDVRAGESTWERGALATMTLNPVIVAVAVLATEDELGRSQVREYEIRLAHDQRAVVRSRYVAERGQCVMLRRGMGADYVIIIAHPVAACAAGGVEP
ncbi:MAG: hypothetical protein H7124_01240 [Phycisphaerales bacterium]|nr:hypothetical protein [Hyphomonadaceae bacterium]